MDAYYNRLNLFLKSLLNSVPAGIQRNWSLMSAKQQQQQQQPQRYLHSSTRMKAGKPCCFPLDIFVCGLYPKDATHSGRGRSSPPVNPSCKYPHRRAQRSVLWYNTKWLWRFSIALAKFRLNGGVITDLEIFVGWVEGVAAPLSCFLYSAYTLYPVHTKLHSMAFSGNLS